MDAALISTQGEAFEGDILDDMQGTVFHGGDNIAGNKFIIGSDKRAFLCPHASGRRSLDTQDQLTLKWSGAYVRYDAAML